MQAKKDACFQISASPGWRDIYMSCDLTKCADILLSVLLQLGIFIRKHGKKITKKLVIFVSNRFVID